MKYLLIPFFFILQVSAQELPENISISRYNNLWQKSPFSDPPPPPIKEVENDLEDWVLVGLEKYANQSYVTLLNKKDTKQRIRVPGPGEIAREFRILEVKREPGAATLSTTVVLQKGKQRGSVAFDPKYLTIRKAPSQPNRGKTSVQNNQKKTATPPGLPGAATQKKTTNTTKKAPRTRYIPPPKTPKPNK